MKEVRYWEATDGTRFLNGDDCYNHEINIRLNSGEAVLKFYDDRCKELCEECIEDNFVKAAYILIGNALALDIISSFGAKYSYIVPKGIGFWKYDEDFDDGYVNVKEEIKFLSDLIESYKEILNAVDIKE